MNYITYEYEYGKPKNFLRKITLVDVLYKIIRKIPFKNILRKKLLKNNVFMFKFYTRNVQCSLVLHGSDITDVSMLGNVHTLDLRGCKEITDVSALGNVHTLDLSYCKG